MNPPESNLWVGGYPIMLVSQSCLTRCDPKDVDRPAPLSMEFSRQEYWSG